MKTLWKKYMGLSIELRASMVYTICTLLQNGVAFLTVPVFARMMSTAEMGYYTTYNSVENILMIFLTLNLAYGSFNTAMTKFEDKRDQYTSSVDMICITLSAIFFVIYLPLKGFFNGLFKLPTELMLLMIAGIVMKNALNCWTGRQRYDYRYKSVVAVSLFISLVGPLVSFFAIRATVDGLKGISYVKALNILEIVVGGIILIYCLAKGRTFFNKKYWAYALTFNIPLIPYYLSQSIFNVSDRIMIDHFWGKSDSGIYGSSYTLAMILTIVLNALNNSYLPWLYRKIKAGERKENQKIAMYIAILMAVLLLGVVTLAPEVILILGKKYLAGVWVVPPVAISLLLLFYSQMFINVEFFFEEKKRLVYGTAVAAIINVVLNYFAIPRFGFVSAAYTTLISYMVFAGMNYLFYKKTLKDRDIPNDLYNMKAMMIILAVFTALVFTIMPLYNFSIVRYIIVLVLGIAIFIKRNMIMGFIRGFKEN